MRTPMFKVFWENFE